MIPIVIKIGDVTSLDVQNWEVSPDDRQQLIETIGGVEVQDFGHVEEGDKFSCSAIFQEDDAAQIYNYWHNRTRVRVIDEGGKIYENMRVIVKRYSYVRHFPRYFNLTLEFWRK